MNVAVQNVSPELAPVKAPTPEISVCHVAAGDGWAGAEAQVVMLLSNLSKCPGLAVHAIALSDTRFGAELRNCGIDTLVVGQNRKPFAQVIRECGEFATSRKAQILHSHNYKENIVATIVAQRCGIPYLVQTAHGRSEPYSPVRQPKHWLVLKIDRLCAKYKANRIVAVSSEMAEYCSNRVDRTKVTLIRNGVDLERVVSALTPVEAKQKLGLPPDCFAIGNAARLEPIKRHDLFLQVAALLAAKLPEVRFVLAGSGRQEHELALLVKTLGIDDRVLLLGERRDVYDVLRAMDLLLLCSEHEGLPIVLLEAMALGVTIVSRNVGGIPDVIRDGVTGVLVSSADAHAIASACMRLYTERALRTRLAEEAYEAVTRDYSASMMAASVAQLYRSLVSESNIGSSRGHRELS